MRLLYFCLVPVRPDRADCAENAGRPIIRRPDPQSCSQSLCSEYLLSIREREAGGIIITNPLTTTTTTTTFSRPSLKHSDRGWREGKLSCFSTGNVFEVPQPNIWWISLFVFTWFLFSIFFLYISNQFHLLSLRSRSIHSMSMSICVAPSLSLHIRY